MKLVFGVVTPIFLLFASIASVASETCLTRAQRCVDRWGSPRTACYDTFRLEACEKTGKYVAPNGNIWPAIRKQAAD